MDLLSALKKIGFTQQEAVIYIELCRHDELTGYEAAKLSGISRSNAYAALSSLVDKGYAYVIEGSTAKYTPVPKEELLMNARRDFDDTIKIIDRELTFNDHKKEPYITIEGSKYVIDKLRNVIAKATLRLYLSCPKEVTDLIIEEIRAAADRGLKVVVLSPNALEGIAHTHYYSDRVVSIKVIADTKEVLAGTLDQCLYSKNGTLVQLIREAFINEIAIIENK